MISGSNVLQIFSISDIDISLVKKIIFTYKNSLKITKEYPGVVTYDTNFKVPLYQKDTLNLGVGTVSREVEIIFTSGSVIKKDLGTFEIEKTLHTELVENDTPAEDDVTIEYVNGIVVATASSNISDEDIATAVSAYLAKNPIDSMTEDEVNSLIATYVTAHKDELKGDQGDKGDKGDDGDTYIITSTDYDTIATIVLGKLESAESEAV